MLVFFIESFFSIPSQITLSLVCTNLRDQVILEITYIHCPMEQQYTPSPHTSKRLEDKYLIEKNARKSGTMVVNTFNPSTQKPETGRSGL